MVQFSMRCRELSKCGQRRTTKRKVLHLMGEFARSETHYRTVVKVLKGHMFTIAAAAGPEMVKTERESSTAQVAPRAGNEKRVHKEQLELALNVPRFSQELICDLAAQYERVETSRGHLSPQGVKSHARMIDRFLRWSEANTEYEGDSRTLLCLDRPAQFVTALARVARPHTVRNYCNALLALIAAVASDSRLQESFRHEADHRKKLERVADVWAGLKRTHERTARREQRVKVRTGKFKNAPIHLILKYLCHVSSLHEDIICPPGGLDVMMESAEPYLHTLNCATACILALHGARLCTALNLAASEVMSALPMNGRFILRVMRHKTAKSSGPAAVALTPGQYRILQCLARLRVQSDGENCNVLPRLAGRACRILFQDVNEFISERVAGTDALTFNSVRKTIHSNEFLIGQNSSQIGESVSNYLCHGKGVATQHYTFRSDKAVLADALNVESIVSTLAVLDLVREGSINLPRHHGTYL